MDIKILAEKFYSYSLFMRNYSPATVARYKKIIDLYCRIMNVSEIEQVTEDNIRKMFYYGRSERAWRSNTYVCHYHSLTVFFRWCVNERYMKESPMGCLELPKMERRLPTRMTKQEALKLLEVVFNYPYEYKFLRFRNHAIFSMFLFSGLRKQELLKIKYADVDVENMSILVRQGKGNRDRIVPMNYKLVASLKKYNEERKRLNRTCPEYFTSLSKNTGYTKEGLKRLVIQMRKASGIQFTIHKLRHTFATLMLEGGCDVFSLSKMLGHSDLKTTTIYLSASIEHLRTQMNKHPLDDI